MSSDQRWARVGPKVAEGNGPPCVQCGSRCTERYLSGLDQVLCVARRNCAERRRKLHG